MHRAQVEAAETSGVPLAWRWGTLWKRDEALGRVRSGCGGPGAAALAQAVDIHTAVDRMALSQQFGASVKTAQVEDGVKKTAADLLKQGDKACMAHDYDAGLEGREDGDLPCEAELAAQAVVRQHDLA